MLNDGEVRMARALRVAAKWLTDGRSGCPREEVGYPCPHRQCVVRRRVGASRVDCWTMAAVRGAVRGSQCEVR